MILMSTWLVFKIPIRYQVDGKSSKLTVCSGFPFSFLHTHSHSILASVLSPCGSWEQQTFCSQHSHPLIMGMLLLRGSACSVQSRKLGVSDMKASIYAPSHIQGSPHWDQNALLCLHLCHTQLLFHPSEYERHRRGWQLDSPCGQLCLKQRQVFLLPLERLPH